MTTKHPNIPYKKSRLIKTVRAWATAMVVSATCALPSVLPPMVVGVAGVAVVNNAYAVPTIEPQAEPSEETVQDSFGRDTPRSTVQGFLSALATGDTKLAQKYLDEDYLAKAKDAKAVVKNFQHNLDIGGRLLPALQISDSPEGHRDDLMPQNKDKVGVIEIRNGKAGASGDDNVASDNVASDSIDIVVVQKKNKDGGIYWQFAKQTLEELPTATQADVTLIQSLSWQALQGITLGGYDMADGVALALLIAMSVFIGYAVIWLLFITVKFLYPLLTKRPFTMTPKVVMPLALVLVAMLLSDIMLNAGVPVTLRTPVERLKEAVAWLSIAWLMLRVIDVVFYRAKRLSVSRNRPEQISLLGLSRKLAKAFMVILAIIVIFGNLGFDLTTGIAALGVGGLALAFGAQKTIENLIGSVVVVADRPVNIGDYCKFGTYEGVVIDVGIRSTRVRTLNRTVVTIPNGDFSSLQIENYATRDMFHFVHNLYIKRHTDLAKLDQLIEHLKAFLDNHSDTNDEWTQVRISELRQDAFVVEVRAYIITTDVIEFYDKQTKLLLQVLQEVQGFGVEYALPSQEVTISTNANVTQQLSNNTTGD